MSAFLVEKVLPGFSDCEVPADTLLSRESDSFTIAMATFDRTRPCVAAQALGIAQGALEYVKTQTHCCKPVAEQQGDQFMVADMAAELQAARLLVY